MVPCLECRHCIDVFWDYANGPYMFICELQSRDADMAGVHCEDFETDGEEQGKEGVS